MADNQLDLHPLVDQLDALIAQARSANFQTIPQAQVVAILQGVEQIIKAICISPKSNKDFLVT